MKVNTRTVATMAMLAIMIAANMYTVALGTEQVYHDAILGNTIAMFVFSVLVIMSGDREDRVIVPKSKTLDLKDGKKTGVTAIRLVKKE